ncbi:MAG: hypothetical protein N3A54_00235 [Patescibacteria group bacterium]|nr:hypothetical protein [Patescibacteria group bacterium]
MMKKVFFIEDQIPFFIRDNYPLFVSLIKSYYDYLDRAQNELVAVKINSPGERYVNPQLRIFVRNLSPNSSTYGSYIQDTRPIQLIPVVRNGRIVKVIVKNSEGIKYKKEENPIIVVQDSSGTGASLSPIILFDMGTLYEAGRNLKTIRDVDTTNEIFKSFLYNELIPTLPVNLYQDENKSVVKEKFIKFIKQLYNSKGIEEAFSFIYRILYNSSVNFYYPKTDILRTSDGVWVKNYWLVFGTNVENFVGEKVISDGITGIIVKCVPHETIPNRWKALIHERTGNFVAGKDVYVFNFKFENGQKIGTILSVEEEEGKYEDDRGFLSSRKKLQDNYYYQEFSYELQSEYNILEFSRVVEELLHPAGFKYFVKILLDLGEVYDEISGTIFHYIVRLPDKEIVCGEDCILTKPLGMTLHHIMTMPFEGPLDFRTLEKEFQPTQTLPYTTDELVIFEVPQNALLQENSMYGYSVVYSEPEINFYKTIVKCIPPNRIKLDSPLFLNSLTPIKIIPGYYPKSVSGAQVQLSDYDPFNFDTANNNNDPNRRYLVGYSMYILYGDAQYQKRKIIGYNGNTRTVTLSSPITGLTTTNVYRIVKDIGGTDYYGKRISSVRIKNGGSGFTNPWIYVEDPIYGSLPSFNITVSGGKITNIQVVNPGGVYYEEPSVSISDLTGTGCVFELEMVGGSENDFYEKIIKLGRIFGNALPCSLTEFRQGFIWLEVSNNIVIYAKIFNSGSGYWFTPRLWFISGDGAGAKIRLAVNNGNISETFIENPGNYYTYAPRVRPDSPNPAASYIISQNNDVYGKILFIQNNKIYVQMLNKPFTSSSSVNFNGINITLNGDVEWISTKNLQVKYAYPTEIEVI